MHPRYKITRRPSTPERKKEGEQRAEATRGRWSVHPAGMRTTKDRRDTGPQRPATAPAQRYISQGRPFNAESRKDRNWGRQPTTREQEEGARSQQPPPPTHRQESDTKEPQDPPPGARKRKRPEQERSYQKQPEPKDRTQEADSPGTPAPDNVWAEGPDSALPEPAPTRTAAARD